MADPMSDIEIPDLVGPIEAWRAFGIDHATRVAGVPCLTALARRSCRWVPGVNRARCLGYLETGRGVFCSTVPSPPSIEHGGHGCGIYGVRFPELLRHFALDPRAVIGRVRLWGRVYPHEHGYRAEYAQIAALYATPTPPGAAQPDPRTAAEEASVLARIAEVYGVAVATFPEPTGTTDEREAIEYVQERVAEQRRRLQELRQLSEGVSSQLEGLKRPVADVARHERPDALGRLQRYRQELLGHGPRAEHRQQPRGEAG